MTCIIPFSLWTIIVILSWSVVDAFIFAFLNNELYVSIQAQTWDRGYQTIWGLYQLKLFLNENRLSVGNVIARIDNIRNDKHDGNEFAFWRPNGNHDYILWPE